MLGFGPLSSGPLSSAQAGRATAAVATGTGALVAQNATAASTTGVSASIGIGASSGAALDIDFTTGTLDSRITFTRASTATYYNSAGLVTSAASGAPRLDYNPVTLLPRGLLLEEQRTNQIIQSGNIGWAGGGWGGGGNYTITYGATAPDGSPDGNLLTSTYAGGGYTFQYPSGLTASPHTASCYVKKGTAPFFLIRFFEDGAAAWLNLTTGAVGTVTNCTATVQDVGNGWLRFAVTRTLANTTQAITLGLSDADAVTNASAVGTTIYLWGAQVEAGAFATSYIPTTTAAVVRAADTAVMTGTNFSSWWNASEGTLVGDFRIGAQANHYLNANQTADPSNNRLAIYAATATDPYMYVQTGGAGQVNADIGTNTIDGTLNKFAIAFKTNDFAGCANSGAVATDTSGTVPTVDRLHIGASEAGAVSPLLWIGRLQFFNTRKTDAELQTLTGATAPASGRGLAAAAATLVGLGAVNVAPAIGTGILVSPSATVASTTNVVRWLSTAGTLASQSAVAVSTGGISRSLSSAATPAASAATVVSTGGVVRSTTVSATLAAQTSAVVSTTGVSRSSSTAGVLAAQRSTVVGISAGSVITGTGALNVAPAIAAGLGLSSVSGIGVLQPVAGVVAGASFAEWVGTGAFFAGTGVITGLGAIPYNVLVSGPYVHRGNLWEGALAWGKIAGKWRRIRVWANAAQGWGIASWTSVTQEVPVIVPAVVEAPRPQLTLVPWEPPPVVAPRVAEGTGVLVAGAAHVTNSNSISGVSSLTHGSWEDAPMWLKVNGKWRRTTMWTKVSSEWKRVA